MYFARDAYYSLGFTGRGGGARCMYLARVLIGKYCLSRPEFITPPPRDSVRTNILYDSVVDDLKNPTIFVVFFHGRCYPDYLITW